MTTFRFKEVTMPETIEEWAALASFILAVASAFAEEHRIMMMASVWSIGYTLLAMRRSK
jgi:hypothetical protein